MITDNSGAYWVTVSTTWKIYADSEEEARRKFERHWFEGVSADELDMVAKATEIDSDWGME